MNFLQTTNPNRLFAILAILVASFVPASSAWAQVAMPAPKMPKETRTILETLSKTSSFDYSGRSVGDVIQELKKNHSVEIGFDKSTKDNQFGSETVVNVTANRMSLFTLLNSIAGEHSCVITIEKNKIVFMSERRENAAELLEWTFDVSRIASDAIQAIELEEAIKQTIDCDNWEDTGGAGAIFYDNGQMMVTQPLATMLKVSGVLQQLHEIANDN